MSLPRAALLFAVIAALAIGLWRPGETGPGGGVEGRLLDARFVLRGPREAPDTVAILAIDDTTLADLGRFPPPRSAIARAIDAAVEGGAAVIAVDLLLAGDSAPAEDAALAAALGRTDAVVLAVSRAARGGAPEPAVVAALARSGFSLVSGRVAPGQGGVLAPFALFARAVTLGHVNIALEPDGGLRRMPLALSFPGGVTMPALTVQAARAQAGLPRAAVRLEAGRALDFGPRRIALDDGNAAAIPYFGPRGTVATYSLTQASDAPLAGRAVFIGATATGFGDTFATPFDPHLPGVEALATMAAGVLGGSVLRRDAATWALDIVLALVFAVAAVRAAGREAPWLAALTVAAVWSAAGVAVQGAFGLGLWLDATTMLAVLIVATLTGAGVRYAQQRRRSTNLARYHSPILARSLGDKARPDFDRRRQDAAALFVDAAGFTARSEALGPEGTVRFLRGFHAAVERAALAHGGVVEQFAGDGAMLIFGLPEPGPADAANALACAEALFAEVAAYDAVLVAAGQPPLSIRIGAHYGPVVAAILGGAAQGHVTVAGDVVNTASRLQEIAKEEGAVMVVSDALYHAAGAGAEMSAGFVPLGPRRLRGRAGALTLWARHSVRA